MQDLVLLRTIDTDVLGRAEIANLLQKRVSIADFVIC